MTFRRRSAATGGTTGRDVRPSDDREAEFAERGAVLRSSHFRVGLFVVAHLGKPGAEKVAFGQQCGDFAARDDLVHGRKACGVWNIDGPFMSRRATRRLVEVAPKTCDRAPIVSCCTAYSRERTDVFEVSERRVVWRDKTAKLWPRQSPLPGAVFWGLAERCGVRNGRSSRILMLVA